MKKEGIQTRNRKISSKLKKAAKDHRFDANFGFFPRPPWPGAAGHALSAQALGLAGNPFGNTLPQFNPMQFAAQNPFSTPSPFNNYSPATSTTPTPSNPFPSYNHALPIPQVPPVGPPQQPPVGQPLPPPTQQQQQQQQQPPAQHQQGNGAEQPDNQNQSWPSQTTA